MNSESGTQYRTTTRLLSDIAPAYLEGTPLRHFRVVVVVT